MALNSGAGPIIRPRMIRVASERSRPAELVVFSGDERFGRSREDGRCGAVQKSAIRIGAQIAVGDDRLDSHSVSREGSFVFRARRT